MKKLPVRHIYRWDLDKTYLLTDFETVSDLLRTAFQKAEEKTTVPGADALLKELIKDQKNSRTILTFISGSPTQMREVLEKKFELDGIHPDAFILKPTLKNILKGRFKAVKGQVGYKLEALLESRIASPDVAETLFGDDSEQDAFIYSLYADIISGKIDTESLRTILVEAEVYASPISRILKLATKVKHSKKIQRIFIHLEQNTTPGRFSVFGRRVIPIQNYFQAALILFDDGVLALKGLVGVARYMIAQHDYDLQQLANNLQDLIRRRHLDIKSIDRLEKELKKVADTLNEPEFVTSLIHQSRALAPRDSKKAPKRHQDIPDYLEILKYDRGLKDALREPRRTLLQRIRRKHN